MRTRVLFVLTGLVLSVAPTVASADETPPPPKPLPVETTSKAPFLVYSALPFSEAAGAGRAFLGAGDLRIMRSDATDDRALTTGPATEFEPAFSPDGTRVAFSSDRADPTTGRTDIWIVKRDGSGLRRVTTGLNARGPVWSPDGKRIAASTDTGITTFAPNGKQPVQVTTNNADHTDFAPAWTGDGTRLIFTRTSRANGATTGQTLWSASAEGKGDRRLLNDTAPAGYLSQPDVSPDGKFVTFLLADASGTAIWLADAATGAVIRRLAFSATGYLNTPAFSPDGLWVLFTHSGADGRTPSSMRLVSTDGRKTKLVARIKQGAYYAPDFDPSGTATKA